MKKIRYCFILAACVALSLCAGKPGSDADLYGKLDPVDYLTGRFDPRTHPDFIDLAVAGVPTDGRPQILRKETAAAFKKLVEAFRKDHPRIRLYICSSTRNFEVQKAIWSSKWTGSALHDGRRLNREIPDPEMRAREILRSSSMPGTSRHHWGTDFDINRLVNSYYAGGEGKIVYQWMTKNAAAFGFCQPYNAGRTKGYMEERWHWSYAPLASKYVKEWNTRCRGFHLLMSGRFPGAEVAAPMAPEYVNAINPACR